jgi:5-formyltetrahydrofolate cyclo-ligase
MQAKAELRATMLALRKALAPSEVTRRSAAVRAEIERALGARPGATVAVYVSVRNEVDTRPLIEAWAPNRRVLVPRIEPGGRMVMVPLIRPSALVDGVKGIPTAHGDPWEGPIDLVIVPGLAFSPAGDRLGYGAGYYDRLLAEGRHARAIGVGYAFQLVPSVPTEPHDVRVDAVLTDGEAPPAG